MRLLPYDKGTAVKPALSKWLFVATVLYFFDLAIPIWVEHRFGVYCDINPITNWLFQLNPAVLYTIKLSLFVLVVLAVRLEARKNLLFAYRSVQSIVLVYSVIDLMWLVGLFLVLRNWWLLWAQPHIF